MRPPLQGVMILSRLTWMSVLVFILESETSKKKLGKKHFLFNLSTILRRRKNCTDFF